MLHRHPDSIGSETERRRAHARRRPAARTLDVERLVADAARGDEGAWASLVDEFGDQLRRLARAHRLSAADADDVVQSTFVRLLDHIGSLRDPRALPGWLTTAVRRESVRVFRANARVRPTDDELSPSLPAHEPVDGSLLATERRAALRHAFAGLPAHQRALLGLLYCEREPSYQEIAAALEVPIGSIGPTRARALARLRLDPRLAQCAAPGP
jgi:RNA polymerase sigma factor (sigma-70 family)